MRRERRAGWRDTHWRWRAGSCALARWVHARAPWSGALVGLVSREVWAGLPERRRGFAPVGGEASFRCGCATGHGALEEVQLLARRGPWRVRGSGFAGAARAAARLRK